MRMHTRFIQLETHEVLRSYRSKLQFSETHEIKVGKPPLCEILNPWSLFIHAIGLSFIFPIYTQTHTSVIQSVRNHMLQTSCVHADRLDKLVERKNAL